MSTYYQFRCPVCAEQGGFFSRQAWGWGNADVVANHKFIVHHVRTCQAPSVDVVIEHDASYGTNESRAYLAETKDVMPHSKDWKFIAELPEEADWREAWHERFADDPSVG